MTEVIVLDAKGQQLSPTSEEKARRLVRDGKAVIAQKEPLTIRLSYEVTRHPHSRQDSVRSQPEPMALPGEGRRILLHTCCAPCATYTIQRLRDLAFDVVAHWYNPNIHPFSEHERRRETLAQYAQAIDLPVIWEPGYDVVGFLQSIHGQERFRVRCKICYRMRIERTAQVATREGFDAFTTTLLISPYQDQVAIKDIGERAAARYEIDFYYENFRRGWAQHNKMTRAHGLYSQRYCGCIYSEWEAQDRNATTLPDSPVSHSARAK